MTTATMPERPPRHTGLVGPVILVGLGVLFLLNNFGVLSWGIWMTLLRLWPILLIAVGLDILVGRRSLLGSLLVTLAMVALLVGGVWWLSPQGLGAAPLTTSDISQPLDGATQADVELAIGVGRLELGAMNEPNGLIAGTITTQQNERVLQDFTVRGDTAVFRLRYRDSGGPIGNRWGENDEWKLQLNPTMPVKLTLNTGVGTARLNLAALNVTDLQIDAGVGETFVTLPRQGQVVGSINGGVGQTTVTIPADVAVRIVAKKGLGNVSTPRSLKQNGNVYESPDYANAANRAELTINGGIGNIQIENE